MAEADANARTANKIAFWSLGLSILTFVGGIATWYMGQESDKAQNVQISEALQLGKDAAGAAKAIADHLKQDEADGVHLNTSIAEWEWLENERRFVQPEKGYLELFNAGKDSVVEVTAFWMFASPAEGFSLNGEVIKAIDSAEVKPNAGRPDQVMHQTTLPIQMSLLFDSKKPVRELDGTLVISGKDSHENTFSTDYNVKATAKSEGAKKYAHVVFRRNVPLDFGKASESWGR